MCLLPKPANLCEFVDKPIATLFPPQINYPATHHPKSPATGPKKPTGLCSTTHCSSSPIKPGWGSGSGVANSAKPTQNYRACLFLNGMQCRYVIYPVYTMLSCTCQLLLNTWSGFAKTTAKTGQPHKASIWVPWHVSKIVCSQAQGWAEMISETQWLLGGCWVVTEWLLGFRC